MKKILLIIAIIFLIFQMIVLATAWDVSTAIYDNKYKVVTDEDTTPLDVAFSSDGTKMYVAGYGNKTVFQYTLTTAWDVSTASYASKSVDISTEDLKLYSVVFSSDGSKMYVLGLTNDTVYQYTLSPAWDLSTADYAEKSKVVTDEAPDPRGVDFSSDGSKMYIVGITNDTVSQYTLSSAWDVSTADYADKSVSVNLQDTQPYDVNFSSDGSKMYIMGYTNYRVFQYTLTTAWDVSTASYASKYAIVSTQDTQPRGVDFNSNGSKMYIMGDNNNTVYQYTLPAGWLHKWNTQTISKWNTKEFTKWNDLE